VLASANGKEFEIPLMSGQKTGAYLDQLENHSLGSRYGHGRSLDGFCYGGGFTLQLAEVCDSVDAVDLSTTALQLARSNAERNHVQNVNFVEANVFDFLRERHSMGERYDTIVLDPPAFARSKENLAGALRGTRKSTTAPCACFVRRCSDHLHVFTPCVRRPVCRNAGRVGARRRLLGPSP
jgi:23S rRNA (cytosine1962-C5)-methyltransferase